MMRRLLVVVCAVAALAGCKAKADSAGAAASASASAGKGRPKVQYHVEVLPLKAQDVDYLVTAPGTIAAFEQVQVVARVAGAVDRVSFTEGGEVKKGQILAVIESERYSLAVNQANVAIQSTFAAEQAADAEVKRREAAIASHPGLITGEEVETYRTKLLTAKAATQSAREALKLAQLNARDAFVRAPMDGVIETRAVQTGQYLQPGAVIATLLQRDPLLVRFPVPEGDAPFIKPGMGATLKLRESSRTYTATVILTAGSADPKTHLVTITAEVADKEHKFWLRPGAFCDVTVPIPARGVRAAIVVPEMAVRATENGFVSYVVENDKQAKQRIVRLGMHTGGGQVQVAEGLKDGEVLVVRGAEPLFDGASVSTAPYVAAAADAGAPAASSGTPEAPPPPTGGAAVPAPSASHERTHGAHDGGKP